jgi:CHAD domain-containing protein
MKLDEGTCVFGASVLLKHLNSLSSEIDPVRQGGEDIDPVHDARVASRRLRATLPLFSACFSTRKAKTWLKQIKIVTRALGEARDTDVQIEWLAKISKKVPESKYNPGINRLILRLRQKRDRLQPPLVKAMDELIESAVLDDLTAEIQPLANRVEEINVHTPALYQHSSQAINRCLDDLLSFEEAIYQPENDTQLHEMRIAAKWLRYTLETFAPLYSDQLKPYIQAVRSIQDLLGEIHDSTVWQAFLSQFLDEERQRTLEYFGNDAPYHRLVAGIQYLEQSRHQEREGLYEKFLTAWQAWQNEKLWARLSQAVQSPLLNPAEIFPPLS